MRHQLATSSRQSWNGACYQIGSLAVGESVICVDGGMGLWSNVYWKIVITRKTPYQRREENQISTSGYATFAGERTLAKYRYTPF
jgi:hypothetical protein